MTDTSVKPYADAHLPSSENRLVHPSKPDEPLGQHQCACPVPS